MKLSELKEHDVYEFSYVNNFTNLENPKHWSEDSIYISDKDFYKISKYIDKFIDNFPYYGPSFKMEYQLWNKNKEAAIVEENDNIISNFFFEVDLWIESSPMVSNFFWILGL